MKKLSVNLFQRSGFRGYVYPYFLSNLAMNRLAYKDTYWVPIVGPDT